MQKNKEGLSGVCLYTHAHTSLLDRMTQEGLSEEVV